MVDTNPVPLTSTPAHAPRLMRWASIASMSVATVLIAAKTGAWLITDSVSMLSSLIDSSLDLVSSLITFIAIRAALTPADEDHRFGHGKAEALAGVAQAGFIAASAGGLLLTVADRFLHPRPVQQEMVGAVVSAVAIVLTLGLMLFQGHVVRRTGSLAITADRAHYTTDFVTNIAVGIGIWASSRFDEPMIDLAVAVGVAFYLGSGAWHIGRHAIDVLMDRELPRHPAVRSVHDLRTRSSGLNQFIQLHLVLHPTMSLGRAHVISDSVEAAIREAFPQADVTVHIDPYDDEPSA
jgi:ferrous-iron efflux pump FieF